MGEDPPKGKGCQLCVQRRVKCDRTRPICNNCRKGNRSCPGYDLPVKFRDEGPKIKRRIDRKRSNGTEKEKCESHELVNTTPDSLQLVSRTSSNGDFGSPDYQSGTSSVLSLVTGSAEQELSFEWEFFDHDQIDPPDYRNMLSLYSLSSPNLAQVQLLSHFRSIISPNAYASAFPVMTPHDGWLAYVDSLTGQDTLLDNAVRAVSMVNFSLNHDSTARNLMVESRSYYIKALRLLNSILDNPAKSTSTEAISAAILLSYYEIFVASENFAWVSHARGVEAMIIRRGPAVHRTGRDRDIFLAYRHVLLMQSYKDNTPTFLEKPAWRNLGRQILSDTASQQTDPRKASILSIGEDMFDEIVKVPRWFHDLISAGYIPVLQPLPPSNPKRLNIVLRARGLWNNLTTLLDLMSSTLTEIGYPPTLSPTYPPDPIVPDSLSFINLYIASMHLGCWTNVMFLGLILSVLHDPSDPVSFETYTKTVRETAKNVMRVVQYMQRSQLFSELMLKVALKLSLEILTDEREKEWVREKLGVVGNGNPNAPIVGYD